MTKFLNTSIALIMVNAMALGGYAAPCGAETKRVAIVVYDAGETLGLLPVAALLRGEGVSVTWMPLTPWTVRLLEQESEDFVELPSGASQMRHLLSRENSEDIGFWVQQLLSLKPGLVITGLVSRIQGDIAHEMREAGFNTRGFCDSFDPPQAESVIVKTARRVDKVWAPNRAVQERLFTFIKQPVLALGQPSVETWLRYAEETDVDKVMRRQGIRPGRRLVVFAGQYGEGYEQVLQAFAKAAAAVSAADGRLLFAFSHHPRTTGELEEKVLKEVDSDHLVLAKPGLSTAQLAVAASVLISWQSTAGIQAAFMGKPVIYFGLRADGYTNVLTEHGLAGYATPETLGISLEQAISYCCDRDKLRRQLASIGFILNADQKIASEVLSILSEHEHR